MRFLIDNALSPQLAAKLVTIILANLTNLADSLQRGCIAVIEESRVRVRRLPIAD